MNTNKNKMLSSPDPNNHSSQPVDIQKAMPVNGTHYELPTEFKEPT